MIELFCKAPQLLDMHGRLPPPPAGEWAWHVEAADLTVEGSVPLFPDAVFTRRVEGGPPDLAVVLAIELDRDEERRAKWPWYLQAAASRFRCPAELVAVCPDADVAAWASEVLVLDGGDGSTHSMGPASPTRPPSPGGVSEP